MSKPSADLMKRLVENFNLENLTCLNFEFSQVEDAHFDDPRVLIAIKNISEINLNGSREISDKTVVKHSNTCSNLTRVELYWNCRINDFCVKKLA